MNGSWIHRASFMPLWVALAATGLCIFVPVTAQTQEIISACGTPMGELEPWGVPAKGLPVDAGMTRRLEEMIRPLVARLDESEALLRATEQGGNVRALLDAMCARQANVCADVLALIGLLGKHEKEVGAWKLGEQRRAVGICGEGFGQDILERALISGDKPEREKTEPVNRWPWCAATWLPFECGVQFDGEEERILAEMGLSVHGHAERAEWAWSTLALFLRQAAVNSSNVSYPGASLRNLMDRLVASMVVEYRLGKPASSEYFQERIELLCGRKNILGLFQPERMDVWSFEDGEYTFKCLRPDAQNVVGAVLGRAPLANALRGGFTLRQSNAETIARAYNYRLAQYQFLTADCAAQCAIPGVTAADINRMYGPFRLILSRSPPCLSPYRVEVVNENWLRFVDEHRAATNATVSGSTPSGKVDFSICLLQSDGWRDAGGDWQWAPRAAGSRWYVERFLAESAANLSGKAKP